MFLLAEAAAYSQARTHLDATIALVNALSSAGLTTATQSCAACMTFISDGYKECSERMRG